MAQALTQRAVRQVLRKLEQAEQHPDRYPNPAANPHHVAYGPAVPWPPVDAPPPPPLTPASLHASSLLVSLAMDPEAYTYTLLAAAIVPALLAWFRAQDDLDSVETIWPRTAWVVYPGGFTLFAVPRTFVDTVHARLGPSI